MPPSKYTKQERIDFVERVDKLSAETGVYAACDRLGIRYINYLRWKQAMQDGTLKSDSQINPAPQEPPDIPPIDTYDNSADEDLDDFDDELDVMQFPPSNIKKAAANAVKKKSPAKKKVPKKKTAKKKAPEKKLRRPPDDWPATPDEAKKAVKEQIKAEHVELSKDQETFLDGQLDEVLHQSANGIPKTHEDMRIQILECVIQLLRDNNGSNGPALQAARGFLRGVLESIPENRVR